MRFALFSLVVALLAAFAMAVAPLTPVIISFPKDAPEHLLDSAKKAIIDANGKITHVYTIIKGFAAEIPESLKEKITTLSTEYPALIESDGPVHTQGDDKKEGSMGIF